MNGWAAMAAKENEAVFERGMLNLLEPVYEAVSGAGGWRDALAAIGRELGARGAMLLSGPAAPPELAVRGMGVVAGVGLSEEDIEAYFRIAARQDLRMQRLLSLPPGSVLADGRDLGPLEIEASLVQREFCRPRGWGRAIYARLPASPGRFACLALYRAVEHGEFDAGQIAIVETLVPHLGRALQLSDRLASAMGRAKSLESMLNQLPMAAVVVDRHGALVGSNQTAEALLQQPTLPLKLRDGLLKGVRPEDSASLQKMVHTALGPSRGQPVAGPEVLRLARTDCDGHLSVLALPLLESMWHDAAGDALVMLYLSDPQCVMAPDVQILGREFRLTSSEARVAAQLSLGASIEDIARRRNVSQETVRAQLKSVMSKTQTHSQGQLVSVLLRSLAALRPLSQFRRPVFVAERAEARMASPSGSVWTLA